MIRLQHQRLQDKQGRNRNHQLWFKGCFLAGSDSRLLCQFHLIHAQKVLRSMCRHFFLLAEHSLSHKSLEVGGKKKNNNWGKLLHACCSVIFKACITGHCGRYWDEVNLLSNAAQLLCSTYKDSAVAYTSCRLWLYYRSSVAAVRLA